MHIASELKSSLSLRFNKLVGEKKQKGERIISLGLKEPVFETPRQIVESTFAAIENGYTKYSNILGLPELRELIRCKLLYENNIDLSVENIVVTPGAKQASLLALMALLEPYDEVINITPCYISYIPQIKIAEPTSIIHNVDLHRKDFSINWEKIEVLMKRKIKVIILNFPHNPTGQILSKKDAERFAEIIARSGSYVLSDEVYDKLVFSNVPSYSIGSFPEIKDKVITVNGFSKAFSMTGWRIGYLAADGHIIEIIARLQKHINTHTCSFVQKGTCAAFALSSEYFISYNMDLQNKVSFMCDRYALNEKLNLVPPQGGLFAFIDISKSGLSSDDFACNLLLKKSVAVTPGIVFGKNWDDHARISLYAPKEEFEEGVVLIDEFVKDT